MCSLTNHFGAPGKRPHNRGVAHRWLRRLVGLVAVAVLFPVAARTYVKWSGGAAAGKATTQVVATGFETIWDMAFLPDGRLLVSERPGRVSVVNVASGQVKEAGRLKVWAQTEAGLMGLALSPGFARNHEVFFCYTHSTPQGIRNRVSRFVLKNDTLGQEKIILAGMKGQHIHDGCRLAFGPDGLLYVTRGDAASQDDAQKTTALNGKVLRIKPDGGIPAGNPFKGSPIFSLGHRNPQGLAFHPVTRKPYVSEHGPDRNDEINLLSPGKNYGWPTVSGIAGDTRFENALHAWTPTLATAGIVFYTGTRFAAFKNDLFLVTLKEQDMRRLRLAPPDYRRVVREQVFLDGALGRLRAITQGPDGYLYIGTSNRDGRGMPRAGDDKILRVAF